jgi:hypothetical protein
MVWPLRHPFLPLASPLADGVKGQRGPSNHSTRGVEVEFLNTTRHDEGTLSTRNDPGGVLLMRIYGMLLIAMLALVLACSPAYSQGLGTTQEAPFFTG